MKPNTGKTGPKPVGRTGLASRADAALDGDASVGVPLARIVPRTLPKCTELVVLDEPQSSKAERFRRLRALLSGEAKKRPKVIVVTSPEPGEGKTLVAMNLALAFASGKSERTLVLDADLRRPSLSLWLDPKPSLGAAEVLAGRTSLEHVVLSIKDSALEVLPAGETPADPVELLSSDRLATMIEQLRGDYDRIIIDTPPIIPFTDADLVAGHCDGVLMVVRFGVTPLSSARKAVGLVTTAPILGTVLNAAPKTLADRRSDYDDHYEKYYSKERKK